MVIVTRIKLFLALLSLGLSLDATVQAQIVTDVSLRDDVKSVQLYCPGAELEAPVLVLGNAGRMVLEFDLLGTEPEALRWRIVHCDRQWRRDDLEPYEFMTGFESAVIERYDFSFTTLRDYVHYTATVPGELAEFIYSGNYAVEVCLDGNEDSVLLRRRFCVTEASIKVETRFSKPYDGIAVDRRQEVDVWVTPREGSVVDPQYLTVTAQQNGRLDNRRDLDFSGYDAGALTYRFRQANIFEGGNTFRYFDCSNLRSPMYNVVRVEDYGGEQFAILCPEEDRSHKHYLSETTLPGGMKVNIWDRENPRLEADYVWVNFSLPMSQPMLDGTIHIVGALTDWHVDSTSAMEYNPRYRAYTKRLLLKQGYYSYQLLLLRGGQKVAETGRLEGDHFETPNRYTIYVYMRTPADRADRMVAVSRVVR